LSPNDREEHGVATRLTVTKCTDDTDDDDNEKDSDREITDPHATDRQQTKQTCALDSDRKRQRDGRTERGDCERRLGGVQRETERTLMLLRHKGESEQRASEQRAASDRCRA